MFWGLILRPNQEYTQTVEHSFRLSMAALDESYNEGRIIVKITLDNQTYALCNLGDSGTGAYNLQVPLDLRFKKGATIIFRTINNSGAPVHLTGYLIPEEVALTSSRNY